ncbi:hypothetical protein F0U62_03830 [Cystobacter fuscus]|nr:hypothetical protein F0U62_03830 [Cystobacter fuscus]
MLHNRLPPSCSLHLANTRRLPPHLTQANTSKSNVLLSHSAWSHSRRLLLHRLLPGVPRSAPPHLLGGHLAGPGHHHRPGQRRRASVAVAGRPRTLAGRGPRLALGVAADGGAPNPGGRPTLTGVRRCGVCQGRHAGDTRLATASNSRTAGTYRRTCPETR